MVVLNGDNLDSKKINQAQGIQCAITKLRLLTYTHVKSIVTIVGTLSFYGGSCGSIQRLYNCMKILLIINNIILTKR